MRLQEEQDWIFEIGDCCQGVNDFEACSEIDAGLMSDENLDQVGSSKIKMPLPGCTVDGSLDEFYNECSWPCNPEVCKWPEELDLRLGNKLIDLLGAFCKCKDPRSFLARSDKCHHTKYIRRNNFLDLPHADQLDSLKLSQDTIVDSSCFLPALQYKGGHSLSCLSDFGDCPDVLLFLRRLGMHFLEMRKLACWYSKMLECDQALCQIDECLWHSDYS